jgi:hypothetical protein
VPVPSAIRVNMFRCPDRTDAAPRLKKGQPAQRTTGVDRANWIHMDHCSGTSLPRPSHGMWPPISRMNTGRASTKPIQNRRDMSASSWFGAASGVTSTGSSAMPQIGQLPGPT